MYLYFRNSFFSFLIILSFSIFSTKSTAQAYVQTLNQYAEWHVTNCNSGCATDKYYTIGDTLINSFHYKFLDLFHYNKNFVIREDTISRKIYMRLLADPVPAKEYLLYDFSLQVNDTISIQNPGSPYPKYAGPFILDSIKVKPLVNKNHRYFYLHSLDTIVSITKTTIWIEGVGSLSLINTPGALPQINGIGQLSCYFYNGINEYSNLDSIANCNTIYPLGITENTEANEYHIKQNYDTKKIQITSLKDEIKSVRIYNIEGKILFDQENIMENKIEIDLQLFNTGVFLLKIENKKRANKFYKLINF